MASETHDLHLLFFPFMAPGHMIPMVDMAKLFATRGVKVTVVTTPANAALIKPTIDRTNESIHRPITLSIVPFPVTDFGLPEGCENSSTVPKQMMDKFVMAVLVLRQPFDQILRDLRPDCVVTDSFLPWTLDVASGLDIPRLVFHGTSSFALCVAEMMERYKPLDGLPSHVESFILPGIPHRIEMLRSQMPDVAKMNPGIMEALRRAREADERSYGVLVNSFYELEPDYAEHLRKVVGRKAWHVGPVSLCNKDVADKSSRGDKASNDWTDCLNWLDEQKPGSVVYVCFGSGGRFKEAQLREIALGLEASGSPFVWVVGQGGRNGLGWVPDGFEERVLGKKKGVIIRGWAPQIFILNHEAVGGFLTHCGWNSSLEGMSAGLPMITWPLFAEQFYNERLILEVVRIGSGIGVKDYGLTEEERELVVGEEIAKAVGRVMGGGEEADDLRRRAREVGEMARRAVEEGGSSYVDMGNLVQELIQGKVQKENDKIVATV